MIIFTNVNWRKHPRKVVHAKYVKIKSSKTSSLRIKYLREN